MNILPIWGTMRMLEYSNDPAYWSGFLESLYLKGIRHIHSSNEYESFSLLTECLGRLSKKGIVFSHIVKLAEPSFSESKFSEERLVSKIDFYNLMLPGKIETIQWMWRSEGADNDRIASFLKQKESVEIAFKKYNICCFPYSSEFADKAIELKNLNGLIIYWNRDEIDYLRSANKASKKNKVNYILRPFGAGKNRGLSSSDMLNYCKEIPSLRGIIFTATKDDHLNEAINFFKSI
jgi:hypothetical protein